MSVSDERLRRAGLLRREARVRKRSIRCCCCVLLFTSTCRLLSSEPRDERRVGVATPLVGIPPLRSRSRLSLSSVAFRLPRLRVVAVFVHPRGPIATQPPPTGCTAPKQRAETAVSRTSRAQYYTWANAAERRRRSCLTATTARRLRDSRRFLRPPPPPLGLQRLLQPARLTITRALTTTLTPMVRQSSRPDYYSTQLLPNAWQQRLSVHVETWAPHSCTLRACTARAGAAASLFASLQKDSYLSPITAAHFGIHEEMLKDVVRTKTYQQAMYNVRPQRSARESHSPYSPSTPKPTTPSRVACAHLRPLSHPFTE